MNGHQGVSEEPTEALGNSIMATVDAQQPEPTVLECLEDEEADENSRPENGSQAIALSQPELMLIPAISAPRPGFFPQPAESHAVTPDLVGAGRVVCFGGARSSGRGGVPAALAGGSDEVSNHPTPEGGSGGPSSGICTIPAQPKMFNIFLPKSQQRVRRCQVFS